MEKRKETVYRCGYCNKPYLSSSGCLKHESYCFNNVENKACLTCEYNDYGRCVEGYNPRDKKALHGDKVSNSMVTKCNMWEISQIIEETEGYDN